MIDESNRQKPIAPIHIFENGQSTQYEFLETMASGAEATVYLMQDENGNKLALKIFKPQEAKNPKFNDLLDGTLRLRNGQLPDEPIGDMDLDVKNRLLSGPAVAVAIDLVLREREILKDRKITPQITGIGFYNEMQGKYRDQRRSPDDQLYIAMEYVEGLREVTRFQHLVEIGGLGEKSRLHEQISGSILPIRLAKDMLTPAGFVLRDVGIGTSQQQMKIAGQLDTYEIPIIFDTTVAMIDPDIITKNTHIFDVFLELQSRILMMDKTRLREIILALRTNVVPENLNQRLLQQDVRRTLDKYLKETTQQEDSARPGGIVFKDSNKNTVLEELLPKKSE